MRKRRLLITFAVLTFAIVSMMPSVDAPSWTTTEVVSTESTKNYSWHPSLAVGLDGKVHIAWDDSSGYGGSGSGWDIFYKRYEVGVGWTSTEVVSTESDEDSWFPSLAVGSDGKVHIAWDDYTDYGGSGADRDIFYKRYEVGVGWTSTEVVSTESTSWSFCPSLAVDSSENIHIAWEDKTNYAGSGTDTDIFYKRYETDAGWTVAEVVSTESDGASSYPSLAVGSDEKVHIAWEDHTDYGGSGGDWDIFYKRYEVGVGWTSTEVVSTESDEDSHRPSLAADSGGNIHIAWEEWTGTDSDILHKRYVAGVGWTSTEVVSTESTDDSWESSLAVGSDGTIHITWYDWTDYGGSGGDLDIFYKRYETDAGWTVAEVVSTESTDHSWDPSLGVGSDGKVHIAWKDDTDYGGSGGDPDIFYKRYEPPVLGLVPDTGFASTTIVGSGFSANSEITITWNGTSIPPVPSPLTTDSDGNFTAIISVLTPNDPGTHIVKATDEKGHSAEATFTLVDMTGPEGPQGEQGETGPQGPQGEQGPAGAVPLWSVAAIAVPSIAAIFLATYAMIRKKPRSTK